MKEFSEMNTYINRYMDKRSKRRNDSLSVNRTTTESRASYEKELGPPVKPDSRPRVIFTNIKSTQEQKRGSLERSFNFAQSRNSK